MMTQKAEKTLFLHVSIEHFSQMLSVSETTAANFLIFRRKTKSKYLKSKKLFLQSSVHVHKIC